MSRKRWISGIIMALLLCWIFPASTLAAETVPDPGVAVVEGAVDLGNDCSLRGLPAGAGATATQVSFTVRQGILVDGPVLKVEASGVPEQVWQSGLLLKMLCKGEEAVLAYYNPNRQPWPAWEIVPGSSAVQQSGNWYALGRITKPGIYAPVVLNARLIADSITAEQIPVQYGERFVFPQLPGGYNIKIMNSSKPELIATDGRVGVPPHYFDTGATVNFRVFKGDEYADSGYFMVKVLAPASAAQAQKALVALKSLGTALGQIQYASSYDELQKALADLSKREFQQLRHLFGKDLKPEQLISLLNRVNEEWLKIMSAHRSELLSSYGSSEAEARIMMDIYRLRAWQQVCQEEPYQWFAQGLDALGWSIDTLMSLHNSLVQVIDAEEQAALNQTRAILRRHTELGAGLRHLEKGDKAVYELRFFGETTAVNDYVQWISSNPRAMSFSDQQGQPALNGSLNPLWQQGSGEAVITAGSKASSDPNAYLIKFKVGSSIPPRLMVEALPVGLYKAPYKVDLLAYGGYGVNDYEITAGRMPNGLKLVDGVIQGIPSEYGYFNFTVRFKDNFYQSSKDYELYVLPDSGEESRLYYEGYQLWYHYNPSEIEHLRTVSSHVKAVNDLQWQQILGPYFNNLLLQRYR
ncbi:MAG: hypothetical protein GXZ09_09830 [Syntrophomonadaceae bacterium]|jgi:hypothetical protein|nr:hypothetical protein [Syntrophomonadaceae bacterium]